MCGATYSPGELQNPVSQYSGATPVTKKSTHYFFRVSDLQGFLETWINSPDRLDRATKNKVLEWIKGDRKLKDWAISRDGPYFGFEIPDVRDKYFYVWLDAPIGYMAATKQFCDKKKKDFSAIWRDRNPTPEYELYHFIGKDIANFHCIFWPALLSAAGFRTPDAVFVHGFLTVNGKKMSKREGTLITLDEYLKHLPPETLRYYYAAKLGPGPEDIDLNLDDLRIRVNGDLVGKVVNIAARTASFIEHQFDSRLAERLNDEQALMKQFATTGSGIAIDYEQRRFGQAIRHIMELADSANRFIADKSPWLLAKNEAQREELHQVCTLSLNLFRTLMVYLDPVVPQLAARAWAFLNISQPSWEEAVVPLLGQRINRYQRLMERIEQSQIQAMEEDIKSEDKPDILPPSGIELSRRPLVPPCSLEQLNAVDIRVARITEAARVAENPKMTRLLVDIGDIRPRKVFASINKRYTSSDLIGRLTIVVANLPPKTFSFGTSEAMLLAAVGNGDNEIFLLSPDTGARPGMRLI